MGSVAGGTREVVDLRGGGKFLWASALNFDRGGIAMTPFRKSERTTIHRLPKQGSYDKDLIHGIIDEAPLCHVGFEHEGSPVVIPCLHGRRGDLLCFHGSAKSRLMQTLTSGGKVCVVFTLFDGWVLARSAFAHTAHYRCVIGYGRGEEVKDPAEKLSAIKTISDRLFPGRWDEVRPASDPEVAATCVATVILEEASAKVSNEGVGDREADLDWPVWAGVVPCKYSYGPPQQDPRQEGIGFPDALRQLID